MTQVPPTQARVWHSSSGGSVVQSPAFRHATHVVSSLHTPASPHGAPGGRGSCVMAPSMHESSVQSLPSEGVSVSSFRVVTPPWPSQTSRWQSPGVCASGTAPTGSAEIPHRLSTQTTRSQGESGAGQSEGAMHVPSGAPPSPPLPPPARSPGRTHVRDERSHTNPGAHAFVSGAHARPTSSASASRAMQAGAAIAASRTNPKRAANLRPTRCGGGDDAGRWRPGGTTADISAAYHGPRAELVVLRRERPREEGDPASTGALCPEARPRCRRHHTWRDLCG